MDREKIHDITMDTITVIVVVYYVYTAINDVTNGRLSTEINARTTRIRRAIKNGYDRREEYRKNIGRVLFDAITTVEDDSGDTRYFDGNESDI